MGTIVSVGGAAPPVGTRCRTLLWEREPANDQLREDGRTVHDLYLEVKTPHESMAPWDYYKILATIPGDKAFPAADPACPLVKK